MKIIFIVVLVSILVPSITPLNLGTLMNNESNSCVINTPTPMTTAKVSEEEKNEIRHGLIQQRADDYRNRLCGELETKANEEYQKEYEALTAAELKKKYDPLIEREKRNQLEKFRHSAFKRVREIITKELYEWDKEYDRRRKEIEEKCKRNMYNADKGKKLSLSHLNEYREKQREIEKEELLRKLDEEKSAKEKLLLAKATEEERKENEKKIREETSKRLKRLEDVKRKVLEEDNEMEEKKRQEFEERKRRISMYTGRKDMLKNISLKNEENNTTTTTTTTTTTSTETEKETERTNENTEKKEENENTNKSENNNNNIPISSLSSSINTITTSSSSTILFSPIPTQSPTLQLSNISNLHNNNNNNNNNNNINSTNSNSIINSNRNLPPLSGGVKSHHNSYPMSEYDLLSSSPISKFKTSQSLPSLSGRSTPNEVIIQTRYLNYSCNGNKRYNGMRRRVKMKILTPIHQNPIYPTLDEMSDIHSNIPSYLTPSVDVSPIK